ncbi:ATP-dependent zinc metalloprotease FtsH [Intestinimonas butyriciproducens]|uniref:ATP-dependent zinc metalloprotease FtsH n=1 Tax=Intestinimonas butyriciproducens TaxID=1297617 RepID=UPI001957DD6F|nr:ATP-dependent zinc metalloprotease FtsH [Intestinimonas butyriciproducens]MBM6918038.1 ATP-dependent zinc metalloprotease FtsH [Intestinimonas butyriciproducens]
MKGIGLYLLLLVVLIGTIGFLMEPRSEAQLTYSDVTQAFENQDVASFIIDENELTMTMRDGSKFTYQIPSLDIFYYDLGETIRQQRAAGTLTQDFAEKMTMPWWTAFLPYLIIIVLFGLFWYYMMNKQDGSGKSAMNFGKSRAKMVNSEDQKVTFQDVAGADEEKSDLQEVVEFLKAPKKFLQLGARIPKGVLLVGPPGTGKTLIAKAVAGEAGVPFFSISGSDFVELYVGVGASRVRDLFDQAKRHAPSIVFIDEIDAVGRQRGAGLGGGHDEREQTLNQLLVEMDGFGANEGVIILAATNRPDILDSALLRPGRFDRQVYIGVPDVKGRKAIMQVHSRKKPFEEDVDFDAIAKTTAGFTGADLENLLNEAALLAARRSKEKIGNREIDDAFLKVIMGNEKKSRVYSEKEKKLTAYHEAGHAIVTRLMPSQDPVHQISIVPRGRAGGFTLSLPKEDKYYSSKNEMEDELVTLLGGRVAEKLVMDDISTGASNDIERASDIARRMVTRYGMSDKLGPIAFGSDHDEVFLGRDFAASKNYSEEVASLIDEEVKRIIDEAYRRCEQMLREHMDILDRVAAYLLEHETMSGEAFEKVFNGEEAQAPEKVVEVDYNARYTHQPEEVLNTSSHAEEIPPEGKPTDHI